MNNKRVRGWQNVDKSFAEYKQVIRKSRTDVYFLINYMIICILTDTFQKGKHSLRNYEIDSGKLIQEQIIKEKILNN